MLQLCPIKTPTKTAPSEEIPLPMGHSSPQLQMKKNQTDTCPLCTCEPETCHHVLKCTNEHMTRCQNDILLKFKAGLTALKTMPYLIEVITQTIKAWLTNNQFEIPNETTNPFHDLVLDTFQTQAGIA